MKTAVLLFIALIFTAVLAQSASQSSTGTGGNARSFDVDGWTFAVRNNLLHFVSPSGTLEIDGSLLKVYEVEANARINETGPAASSILRQTSGSWSFDTTSVDYPAWLDQLSSQFTLSSTVDVTNTGEDASISLIGGFNQGSSDLNLNISTNGTSEIVTVSPGAIKFDVRASWPSPQAAPDSQLVFAVRAAWTVNIGDAAVDVINGETEVSVNQIRNSQGTVTGFEVIAGSTNFRINFPAGAVVYIDGRPATQRSIRVVEGQENRQNGGITGTKDVYIVVDYASDISIDPVMNYAGSASSLASWLSYFF